MNENGFSADWFVPPPSRTITSALRRKKLTALQFSKAAQLDFESFSAVVDEEAPIWPELAGSLERYLGGSADFWLCRDRLYRESLHKDVSAELQNLFAEILPLKEMKAFGWLKEFERSDGDLAAAARFFAVKSAPAFMANYGGLQDALSFRKSEAFQMKLGPLAAWFRAAELDACRLECQSWSRDKLIALTPNVRALSLEKNPRDFLPALVKVLASAGVAVCIIRCPRGCPVSGATKFIAPDRAMIALSFRYLSDDHFWFSLMHEIGHLVLHSPTETFIEMIDEQEDRRENEANKFAFDALIPPDARADFESLSANKYEVVRFARRLRISPGVVVGQLQHAGRVRRNQLNFLKRRYIWGD